MERKIQAYPFEEVKAIDESGSFEGYASIFGNVDLGYDVIERGAFKELMTNPSGQIIVLNQHNQRDPIGTATVKEDDKGLYFKAQLILGATSARNAHALMKGGALRGMSIGFDVLEGGAEIAKSGVRMLKGLRLWEISPVTFGMNPLAGIDGVKAAATIRTIREFEDFLRDVGGYSNAQAKALASGGYKQISTVRDESGVDEQGAAALLEWVRNL